MIHTVKDFQIVNETEVDILLEFPCFLHDPTNVDNLIFDSSAFPKPSLFICKLCTLTKYMIYILSEYYQVKHFNLYHILKYNILSQKDQVYLVPFIIKVKILFYLNDKIYK